MKKLVILIALLLSGCNLYAQTNAYDFYWIPNSEPDMGTYKIWTWEGPDTTTILEYQFLGQFSHDSLVAIWGTEYVELTDIYPSVENGEYVGYSISAVDTSGNESGVGYSWFYKKVNTIDPSMVQGIGIKR